MNDDDKAFERADRRFWGVELVLVGICVGLLLGALLVVLT